MPIENGENRNKKGQFVAGNTASVGKGRPKGSKDTKKRKTSGYKGNKNAK